MLVTAQHSAELRDAWMELLPLIAEQLEYGTENLLDVVRVLETLFVMNPQLILRVCMAIIAD